MGTGQRGGPSTYHGKPLAATLGPLAGLMALALIGSAGCARSAGAAATPQAPAQPATRPAIQPLDAARIQPFLVPGENITWEVRFLGFEGGRARLAVGSPGDLAGRQLIGVVAEAESSGLLATVRTSRDQVSSWIDMALGHPARTDSEIFYKGRHLSVSATHPAPGGEAIQLTLAHRGEKPSHRRQRVPRGEVTHDPVSAILLMRALADRPWSRTEFVTLGGLKLWSTELTVEGRENVDTPLGRRMAVRMSGVSTRLGAALSPDKTAKPRQFVVWISDDAERVPLLVRAQTEFGAIEVLATSYAPPR